MAINRRIKDSVSCLNLKSDIEKYFSVKINPSVLNRLKNELDTKSYDDLNNVPVMCMFADSIKKRVALNKIRGVKIGENVFIDFGVWIEYGFPEMVTIEDNVVIAAFAKIIGHDSSLNNMFDFPIRKRSVRLKKNCYIGTGAIIMPGVVVGEKSIIGAGAVVTKSIPDNAVAIGCPAIRLMSTDEFLEKSEEVKSKYPNEFFELDSSYRPNGKNEN